MKKSDLEIIKKVLDGYCRPNAVNCIMTEIENLASTNVEDEPVNQKPDRWDLINTCGFLANIANGLIEDAKRDEQLAEEYKDDDPEFFRRMARINKDDANSLLAVREWLKTV